MGCSLVAPALILLLAAALVAAARLPDSLAIASEAIPLVVFGGGVLFGLLTRRYRLVLGVVVLALTDAALVNFGGREVTVAVAVLLLPLNLAVIAWLGREIPLAGRGAALFGLAFLQAGLVALLHQSALASLAASDRNRRLLRFPGDPRRRCGPPHAAARRHGAHEGGRTRPGLLSRRPASAKQAVSVTISIGVAESEGNDDDPHKVLRTAEHALDRAKPAAPQAIPA